MLLECLTGRREYPGPAVEAAVARLHRDPVVPDNLPPPWPNLLSAMTAAEPEARPTAADVADTLARQMNVAGALRAETLASDDPPTAVAGAAISRGNAPGQAAPTLVGTPRTHRRGLRRVILVTAALALALACFALFIMFGTQDQVTPITTPDAVSPTSTTPQPVSGAAIATQPSTPMTTTPALNGPSVVETGPTEPSAAGPAPTDPLTSLIPPTTLQSEVQAPGNGNGNGNGGDGNSGNGNSGNGNGGTERERERERERKFWSWERR